MYKQGKKKIELKKKKESRNLSHKYDDEFAQFVHIVSMSTYVIFQLF